MKKISNKSEDLLDSAHFLILSLLFAFFISCNSSDKKASISEQTESIPESVTEPIHKDYLIVLYDDNELGYFTTSEGVRICGIDYTLGSPKNNQFSKTLFLTDSIKIFGAKTDRLDIQDGKIMLGRFDEDPGHSSPVTIENDDNCTIIKFSLDDEQSKYLKEGDLNYSELPDNLYNIVYFPDTKVKTYGDGTLFGPNHKIICGAKKRPMTFVYFNKNINFFGKTTDQLCFDEGYIYFKETDIAFESTGHTEYRIGTYTEKKGKDYVVFSFENVVLKDKGKPRAGTEKYVKARAEYTAYDDSIKASRSLETQDEEAVDNYDKEMRKWLKGQWAYEDIDRTMYEIRYDIYTFNDDYFYFSSGTEVTLHRYPQNIKYTVKDDVIYDENGNVYFTIDKQTKSIKDTNGKAYFKN